MSSASQRAVRGLELVHRVVLQRAHHVADETLRVHVGDACFRIALLDEVRDRVHQMRLAQADAAIEEQRVVGAAGVLGDLARRGLGELIALALDEGGEGKFAIEAGADHQAVGAACARGQHGHGRRRAAQRVAARADLDRDDRHIAGALVSQQLADAWQQIRIDPLDHEAVGCQELEGPVALHGLQRPHPGIELLLRKLGLQRAHAASPKRRFHARLPPRGDHVRKGKGREVYTDRAPC